MPTFLILPAQPRHFLHIDKLIEKGDAFARPDTQINVAENILFAATVAKTQIPQLDIAGNPRAITGAQKMIDGLLPE